MTKRNIMIVVICFFLLFVIVASGIMHIVMCKGKQDIVIKKETAIKIGSAILEEYSEKYWSQPFEGTLDAIEKKKTWIVYSVSDGREAISDESQNIIVGGRIYVEILKSNGKIQKIRVDD